MTLPTYDELAAAVAELTAAREKPLTLDDLPLADLRKKLIDNGDPLDLSVLALTGQVADFGKDGVKVRFGSGTVTWPGASQLTGVVTVTHGMGLTPTAVVAIATFTAGAGSAMVGLTGAPGATTFTIQGYNPGGAPVAGTTSTFYWLAIG